MPGVPLLLAPVQSVRDATRAVKRLAGQAIQTVIEATLNQFLERVDSSYLASMLRILATRHF